MRIGLWTRIAQYFRFWMYRRSKRAIAAAKDETQAAKVVAEEEYWPVAIPSTRRSLTALQPSQQQCRLLSLPVELRLQIYEHVLSEPGVVHLFLRRCRVGHVRCSAPHSDPERDCMAGIVNVRNHHKHYELSSSSANTALLQTCRAIYREAVDVLYTTNTFDASHPQTFVYFARTIPPRRLAAITSLNVTWMGGRSPVGYELSWGHSDGAPVWWGPLWEIVITQMPRLRHLRLRLCNIDRRSWREAEDLLLRSLLPLRGLSSFELERARVPEPSISVAGKPVPVEFSELGNEIRHIVCAPSST